MKRKTTMSLLYAGSVLILLAGIILSAITVRQMPVYAKKLSGNIDTLQRLRDLERIRDRQQSAIRAFDLLTNSTPALLSALTASSLAGATPEIRVRESLKLPNGWVLGQVEVVCGDMSLDQVPAFLNAAEAGRPPWRLTECHITASRPAGGFGRVVLIMEALAKSSP